MSHQYDAPMRPVSMWSKFWSGHEPRTFQEEDRTKTVMHPESYEYYWKMDWPEIHRWNERMETRKNDSWWRPVQILGINLPRTWYTEWLEQIPRKYFNEQIVADILMLITNNFSNLSTGTWAERAGWISVLARQLAFQHPSLYPHVRRWIAIAHMANKGRFAVMHNRRGVQWLPNTLQTGWDVAKVGAGYFWRKHLRSYRRYR